MSEAQQLAESLCGENAAARQEAAQRLAEMGEEAQPAAVALVESLDGGDDTLQEWAVAALEQLGPPDPADIARLTQLLRSDNELVGYWASTLLGRLGEEADQAVPQLVETLGRSSHPSVQQRTAWALGKVGSSDPRAVEALQTAAASRDARLSRLAKQSLEQLTS